MEKFYPFAEFSTLQKHRFLQQTDFTEERKWLLWNLLLVGSPSFSFPLGEAETPANLSQLGG